MAKVTFTRWVIAREQRRPISVEPSRVDVIEHYQDAVTDSETHRVPIAIWWGEEGHDSIPAATRIIMHNKQEFFVQGSVEEVTAAINAAAGSARDAQGRQPILAKLPA